MFALGVLVIYLSWCIKIRMHLNMQDNNIDISLKMMPKENSTLKNNTFPTILQINSNKLYF